MATNEATNGGVSRGYRVEEAGGLGEGHWVGKRDGSEWLNYSGIIIIIL